MVEQNSERASGEPGANEEARVQAAEIDTTIDDQVLPEERARNWRHPGFSRIKLNWFGEDRDTIAEVRRTVDEAIFTTYEDAYRLMARLYNIIRIPILDADGQPVLDSYGLPQWQLDTDGTYIEDWTRLARRQREDFLGSITAALFRWEQRAAELWGDAMMAKAQFEERFAISYDEQAKGTVEGRTARGNIGAAEERYFAIYLTMVSRRADAVVRSMDRLQTRLKDLLVA